VPKRGGFFFFFFFFSNPPFVYKPSGNTVCMTSDPRSCKRSRILPIAMGQLLMDGHVAYRASLDPTRRLGL